MIATGPWITEVKRDIKADGTTLEHIQECDPLKRKLGVHQ